MISLAACACVHQAQCVCVCVCLFVDCHVRTCLCVHMLCTWGPVSN